MLLFNIVTLRYNTWTNERILADEILQEIRKKGVEVKLDDLTKGDGNCFMIGTLQQMKREDVQVNLNEEQKGLKRSLELRRSVHRFTLRNESHPLIRNLKIQFTAAEKMSWQEYWRRMTNGKPDMLWADGWFIQLTAWYLEMTFFIMDTTCPKDMPYIIIPGDFGSGESNVLLLGLKPPVHYQSLLWDVEESPDSLAEEEFNFDPFDLLNGKSELELEFASDSEKTKER